MVVGGAEQIRRGRIEGESGGLFIWNVHACADNEGKRGHRAPECFQVVLRACAKANGARSVCGCKLELDRGIERTYIRANGPTDRHAERGAWRARIVG
jgi:hypothetical protein